MGADAEEVEVEGRGAEVAVVLGTPELEWEGSNGSGVCCRAFISDASSALSFSPAPDAPRSRPSGSPACESDICTNRERRSSAVRANEKPRLRAV
jgi:hypothetical protein